MLDNKNDGKTEQMIYQKLGLKANAVDDRIKKEIKENYLNYQSQVYRIIGFNFDFKTPFECLQNFETQYFDELRIQLDNPFINQVFNQNENTKYFRQVIFSQFI